MESSQQDNLHRPRREAARPFTLEPPALALVCLVGQIPDGHWKTRRLEEIKYIVIHHSGVAVDSMPEEIARYHQSLGWPGCGYHLVVSQAGVVYLTGFLAEVRYNVAGRNREVVGICLPGNFNLGFPCEAQLAGARQAIDWVVRRVGETPVVGHRDIALPGNGTDCPGSTWGEWQNRMWREVVG